MKTFLIAVVALVATAGLSQEAKAQQHNYVLGNSYSYHSGNNHVDRYELRCTIHGDSEWHTSTDYGAIYFSWFSYHQYSESQHRRAEEWRCDRNDGHVENRTSYFGHTYNHPTDPNYCTDCGHRRWP